MVAHVERGPLAADELRELMGRFVERVDGDWVLLGGALVALWLDGARETFDVDIVSRSVDGQARLELLAFGHDEGLGPEGINSAADFFLRRLEGWEEGLVELMAGARGRILRPSITHFVLLKLRRLSEQDLQDVLLALERATRGGEAVDDARLLEAIEAERGRAPASAERSCRLDSVRAGLSRP